MVRKKRLILLLALIVSISVTGLIKPASGDMVPSLHSTPHADSSPTSRNPRKWPFAWDSIWNMPIGTDANYVYAGIKASKEAGMTADEDIVILEPDAPRVDVFQHDADWDQDKKRCERIRSEADPLLKDVPIPNSFSTDSSQDNPEYLGITPNHSTAILMPDGFTIKQTQPFHRCRYQVNMAAVSQYLCPDANIKIGDGIQGCHGGSGMSSLGGTIRMGELVPGGVIRHALKVNLDASQYLFYDPDNDGTPGFRWPATRSDYASGTPPVDCRYGGQVSQLQMGALLALKPDFPSGTLRTEPARIIAQAFKDYGGYVVDDTAWDVYALATEWGPSGRVIDEFHQVWGFPFDQTKRSPGVTSDCTDETNKECQWAKDMADIFTNLYVIDNNGPSSIGGPGERGASCAPPFDDGTGALPVGSICNPDTGTPNIKVKTQKLKFGTVKVGRNKIKNVRIRNQGNAGLTVSAIKVSPSPPFALVGSDTPFTVLPNEERTIAITFTPTGKGKVEGTSNIISNDADQPDVKVALEGKGKAGKKK